MGDQLPSEGLGQDGLVEFVEGPGLDKRDGGHKSSKNIIEATALI